MFLGIYNLIDNATLSAGSWTTLDNVKNDRLYSVARSTDATTASTKFQIDLGTAQTVTVASLHAHNLSAAATINLLAGTSAGASDTLNSTGNDAYSVTFDATRAFSAHYAVTVPAGVSARYWTIEIVDPGNSAGYVDIGRVGLWAGLEPANNASWGIQYGIDDSQSRFERAIGGDFLYSQEPRKRTAAFSFEVLTDAETAQCHELLRVAGLTGEVLFYPGDQTYDMLGVLTKLGALTRKSTNINAVDFEVIER